MALTITATIGGTSFDLSGYVIKDSVSRRLSRHNEALEPTTDTCSFLVRNYPAFLAALYAKESDVSVSILDGSTPYFYGFLTDNYSFNVLQTGAGPIKLQVEDPGIKKLKKAITSNNSVYTDLTGKDVCKPTDMTNSAVHILAALAGVTVDSSITAIDRPLENAVFCDDEKPEYWTILKDILFEYGYIFYFQRDGKLNLYDLVRATISTSNVLTSSGSGKNIIERPEIKRKRREYKQVEVKWQSIKTIPTGVIFSDTTGGTAVFKCNIPVAAGAYYPESADDDSEEYSEYKLEDGSEIISVQSVATDFIYDSGITSEFTDLKRKCKLKLHNPTGAPKNIRRLDLVGTNIKIYGAINKTRSGVNSDDRLLKIEAKYLSNLVDAKTLANLVEQHYRFANYQYGIRSPSSYYPGDLVQIDESVYTGIDTYGVIIEREDSLKSSLCDYTILGISSFDITVPVATATTNLGESVNNPLASAGEIFTGLGNRPTYAEILDGFEDEGSGATNIPADLPAPVLSGSIENTTATLHWDRPAQFTGNDIRYRIYRSDELLGTYDLIATVYSTNVYTDAGLALGGTEETPTSKNYFYKVALANAIGQGPDSNTVTLEAYAIEENQLAASSISVGKLKADILSALMAQIGNLVISDTYGFVAGPSADSGLDEGDRRVFQNQDSLKMQEYRSSAWRNLLSMVISGEPGNRQSSVIFGPNETSRLDFSELTGLTKLIKMAALIKFRGSWIMGTFGAYSAVESSACDHPTSILLPDGKLLCIYIDSNRYLCQKVRETNGTWGTASTIESVSSNYPSLTVLPDGRVVCVYVDYDTKYLRQKIRATDGTWGSYSVIESVISKYPSIVTLPDGKVLLVYGHYTDSSFRQKIRATDGTWGAYSQIEASSNQKSSLLVLADGSVVCVDSGGANIYLRQRIRAVDGTWGSASTIESAVSYNPSLVSLLDGRILCIYRDAGTTYLRQKIRAVDGAWGAYSAVENVDSSYPSVSILSDGKIICIYKNTSNGYLRQKIDTSGVGVIPIKDDYIDVGGWEIGQNAYGIYIKTPFGITIQFGAYQHTLALGGTVDPYWYSGTGGNNFPIAFGDYTKVVMLGNAGISSVSQYVGLATCFAVSATAWQFREQYLYNYSGATGNVFWFAIGPSA
jgi:hypothetical protein